MHEENLRNQELGRASGLKKAGSQKVLLSTGNKERNERERKSSEDVSESEAARKANWTVENGWKAKR